MATSLASLPTSFCLNHVDECFKRSHTKPSLSSNHQAARRNLIGHSLHCYERSKARRLVVTAATEGSRKSKESQPSWANPDSDEPPPWARDEGGSSSTSQESFEVPFFVYLLASAITAIAAVCLLSFSVTSDYTDSYQRCLFFRHLLVTCRLVLFLSTRVRIQCSGCWNPTASFILLCLVSSLLLESPLL